jgi:hypothetical protein
VIGIVNIGLNHLNGVYSGVTRHSIYCLPLLAQSFSGPSPLELATILYPLRFETYFVVASYCSQGLGESIRPRLLTGSLICVLLSSSEPF